MLQLIFKESISQIIGIGNEDVVKLLKYFSGDYFET